MWMVDKTPELLPLVKIRNDKGRQLEVLEFLDEIKKLINKKYQVVDWLENKTKYKTLSRSGQQRPDDNMQHDHFVVKHK